MNKPLFLFFITLLLILAVSLGAEKEKNREQERRHAKQVEELEFWRDWYKEKLYERR